MRSSSSSWPRMLVATLAFAAVIVAFSYRASQYLVQSGQPNAEHWVMQDFRDVVYYPARAFLDGHNPYDSARYIERYPVWHPLAMYSPLSFVLHAPFALLPFDIAWRVYLAYNLTLLVALAALGLRISGVRQDAASALWVAAAVLLSRPGYMTTLLGQVGAETAVTASVALYCSRTRPWLAATALALCTFKPSFGALLGFLLLWRGEWLLVVRGAALAAVVTSIATARLLWIAGGIGAFTQSLIATTSEFGTEQFDDPVFGPFRIDVPALVAKLANWHLSRSEELVIGFVFLLIGAWFVSRCADAEKHDVRQRISGTLISLIILGTTYHQTYDLLLLVPPGVALGFDRWLPERHRRPLLWTVIAGLWLVLALNYAATATVIESYQLSGWLRWLVTLINPTAVFGLIVIYSTLAWQARNVRHS